MRALTASESQRTFRACLDALARPGQVVPLDRSAIPSGVPAAYLPMLALTDLMTPVAALDDDPLVAQLAIVTGAPLAAVPDARWVVCASRPSPGAIATLNRGTALSPEHGAILCQQVDSFADGGARLPLLLDGPGIDGVRALSVAGIDESFVEARTALVDYPHGIDVLLVADDGIVGLPRTTHIRVAETEDAR